MQDVKCVEALLTHLEADMKFCVVTRLKEDTERINNRGGKVMSTIDPRICLVIPKGAIRFSSTITMKVYNQAQSTNGMMSHIMHIINIIWVSNIVMKCHLM